MDAYAEPAVGGFAHAPGTPGLRQGPPRVTTKAEFLGRIRDQVRRTPGRFAAAAARRPQHPAADAETIRRELAERWLETLEAFRREFESVGGVFYKVGSVDMVP